MKQLIALILFSSIILQNCSSLFVLLDYRVNKSYIATTLCVNKDKPKLNCQGKCHLSKRLATEEEKKEQQKENTLKFSFNTLFCQSLATPAELSSKAISYTDSYEFHKYISPVFSIFHPPLN